LSGATVLFVPIMRTNTRVFVHIQLLLGFGVVLLFTFLLHVFPSPCIFCVGFLSLCFLVCCLHPPHTAFIRAIIMLTGYFDRLNGCHHQPQRPLSCFIFSFFSIEIGFAWQPTHAHNYVSSLSNLGFDNCRKNNNSKITKQCEHFEHRVYIVSLVSTTKMKSTGMNKLEYVLKSQETGTNIAISKTRR